MADYSSRMPSPVTRAMISTIHGKDGIELDGRLDWDALCITAEQEGVAGIWYHLLKCRSASEQIPRDVLARLEASYRRTQVKNVLLREALRDVLKRMNEAQIPVILLKGAALSELVYVDIGLRPMCDLDLLVPMEHAERAIGFLLESGYQRKTKPELRIGFDQMFRVEVELQTPPPNVQQVEIHWKLLSPLFACRFVGYEEIWERATPTRIVDQPAYILGAEDWVLHLAAHAFYKHRKVTLQVLYDVDRLICFYNNILDWDRLLEVGRRFRWLPALAAVLLRCTDDLGTPIPPEVIQSTLEDKLPKLDQWILDWWMQPGRSERSHTYPDWLTLPNLATRGKVLWAYLFPQKTYRDIAFSGHPKWHLPVKFVQRWWEEIKA